MPRGRFSNVPHHAAVEAAVLAVCIVFSLATLLHALDTMLETRRLRRDEPVVAPPVGPSDPEATPILVRLPRPAEGDADDMAPATLPYAPPTEVKARVAYSPELDWDDGRSEG